MQNVVEEFDQDGLGREITRILTDPEGDPDYVNTTYDGLDRVQSVSNPYRTNLDSSYGITSYSYDALGRVTNKCQPDNSSVAQTTCVPQNSFQNWSYYGNYVTFTDEAGNQWKRTSDGLGRLTQVLEPNATTSPAPAIETDYTYDNFYDAYDHTSSVVQHGVSGETARTRSFTYDSLGRLLEATNPETGMTCYGSWSGGSVGSGSCQVGTGYYANGNLKLKTDARNITTNYYYDVLNRLTLKTYSDGTLAAHFAYDQPSVTDGSVSTSPANPIGRLTSQYVGASAPGITMKSFSYDPMGRPVNSMQCWGGASQCTSSGIVSSGRQYDLAGNPTLLDDGSVSFIYTYDSAGRLSQLSVEPDGSTTQTILARYFSYNAAGQQVARNGWESWIYDNRLRVKSYTGLDGANLKQTQYGYSLNYYSNDNVQNFTEQVQNTSWTWNNTYDHLNRLWTATNTVLSEGCTESYDSFGNRISQTPSGGTGYTCPSPSYTFSQGGNNRIDGFCYDAAGNLLDEGACPQAGHPHTFAYDAEGRLSSAESGAVTYVYSADGMRATKNSSQQMNYVYDYDGKIMAHVIGGIQISYAGQPQEVWLNGQNYGYVSPAANGMTHTFVDWLAA